MSAGGAGRRGRGGGGRAGAGAGAGRRRRDDRRHAAAGACGEGDSAAGVTTPGPDESDDAERAFEPTFADLAGASLPDVDLPAGTCLGRVIRLDRGYPLVCTPGATVRTEHAVALVKGSDLRASVGDWVCVRMPDGHDKARIEEILPRATTLSRWDGRSRGQRQVLAANLDLVVVVQPLSRRPVSPDRVARSAVLAREGSVAVAVVLTKADRTDTAGVEKAVSAIRACLPGDLPIVVTSSQTGAGLDETRALLRPGTTTLLLGESGAGKSTLVNGLVGAAVLGTGAVRARDDTGRHTTVARRMIAVPGAGVIVDAPGLRSLPLLDESDGLAATFPDIAAHLGGCRFRDCTHGDEPGCAVRAAVRAGEIPEERLAEYRALEAEMLRNRRGLDPAAPQSLTS